MRYLFGLLCLLLTVTLPAAEVGDVELPDQVRLANGDELVLNGAGMRKKFFVSVYAAGLYLPHPMQDAEAIVAADGPWRMVMHFVYDEVSRTKIVDGWKEGFHANLDDAAYTEVAPQLESFNALFRGAVRDDVYTFTFRPGQGTEVDINGEVRGEIGGPLFARALLSVWLGPHPADDRLKRALLGN